MTRLTPKKPPIKPRLPKGTPPNIVPEYSNVPLPEINLSVPWYHKERFQKIAGLSGAIAGAVLYFIPGTQALGEIVGGLGLASWGTAAGFHRIKKRRAAGQNTWLDVLLTIIRKIMQFLGTK